MGKEKERERRGLRGEPEETPVAPAEASGTAQQQTERVTALPPGGGASQEQPPSLMDVVRHEVTPGAVTDEERREAGADPADRDAQARKAQEETRRQHLRWTVLHPVIHNGRTYHPGSELGEEDTFDALHAQPLIDAGRIVEGTGDEVAHHVHRAHLARHQSLVESGIPAGTPPAPPEPSERRGQHVPSDTERAHRLGVSPDEGERQVARESFPRR
jgi:hypothetical protein